MLEFCSISPEATEDFASAIARTLQGGTVIAFLGGMGMGKTHFTRGLARGLGFKGDISSPTFAIINEYRGGRLPLFHFDMYRIESWEDLDSCGFFDYINENGVVAVEWSENVSAALPENTIYVTIERVSDTSRRITVEGGRF